MSEELKPGAEFRKWFESEWGAYEDKAFTDRITSMAWALKAWRHKESTQTLIDYSGVMGIPPRTQQILGDPNGYTIVKCGGDK